jgi:2-polyprenyl-6-methoxyphenol hydroxylase-like FAD-dependent oxidoreductase
MTRTDVLVVGAGPTGLVLALWLTKLGVNVRIIDKTSQPGTTSRAVAVQARTLELYRQLDLSDAVVSQGHTVPAINLWVQGETKARIAFDTINAGLTPYGPLIFPQDEHEQLLIAKLETFGVRVERQTELIEFSDQGDGVVARLRTADGQEQQCQSSYIAGCDGARSVIRHGIGVGFPGGTYQQVFYVADVEASGPAIDGELHVDLDEADFLAIFPLKGPGRARLIGTVRDERAERAETLTFDDVSSHAIDHLKVRIEKVNWFSTYRVHHRVADRFAKGRIFLLGDAAHIHSPAGGQGMNTGIGDAINLAWKLAAVIFGHARSDLLISYEEERIAFARRLVATTDRAFTLATAEGRIAEIVRTRIVPVLAPAAFRYDFARRFMFETVSQITLNYRGCALSQGAAGAIKAGDRLPWAPVAGADNFDLLSTMSWQVHVYGSASPEIEAWCTEKHISLHAFEWHREHEAAGLVRDALYLLRPDSYLALVTPAGTATALERYFAGHGIKPWGS